MKIGYRVSVTTRRYLDCALFVTQDTLVLLLLLDLVELVRTGTMVYLPSLNYMDVEHTRNYFNQV